MTYRIDSELPWIYAKVIDLESNQTIAPAKNIKWKKVEKNFQGL
jgi:hypothetical protein